MAIYSLKKIGPSSGAKFSCMADNAKPTLQEVNLNHIIHKKTGTNEFRT